MEVTQFTESCRSLIPAGAPSGTGFRAVAEAIHRACFANTTPEDSQAAVEVYFSAEASVETAWFQSFVEDVVLKVWLNKVPKEEYRAALDNVLSCISSDEKASTLLPLPEVITSKYSQEIAPTLSQYIELRRPVVVDPVYDRMWKALSNDNACLTLAEFTKWFTWFYTAIFDNATPKRAEQAAKTHWFEAISWSGLVDKDSFVRISGHIASFYCSGRAPESVYASLLQDQNNEDLFEAKVTSTGQKLRDPIDFFSVDSLNSDVTDSQLYRYETENRILIIGKEGVGKSTLARDLAKQLNAVNLDTLQLALDATRNAGDALGAKIRLSVQEQGKFDSALQIELLRRALDDPATKHRGYVLADLPPSTVSNPGRLSEFYQALKITEPPQHVIALTCPEADYEFWQHRAHSDSAGRLDEEDRLRVAELEEKRRVEEKARRKEDLARRREAFLDRKAKIDAGELQPGPEDENEPPEEEPEEEKVPVDADGNPLEGDALTAFLQEEAKRISTRRFESDLFRAWVQDRTIDLDEKQIEGTDEAVLQDLLTIARNRSRFLDLPCYESTANQVQFAIAKLKLLHRPAPTLPTVPAEAVEGVDVNTVEGEAVLADLRQRALQEETVVPFSSWQKFCPVTWAEDKVLVEGSFLYACVYRNRSYLCTSAERLRKFMASPHPYLNQSITVPTGVAALPEALETFSGCSFSPNDFFAALAEASGLTYKTADEFGKSFDALTTEQSRLNKIRSDRAERDSKATAMREERKRRQKEADAKKKKTERTKKKKGEEEKVEDAEPETKVEETKVADDAPATIAQKLQQTISQQVQKQRTHLPLLVDCCQFNEGLFSTLASAQAFPETVLLLENRAPAKGEEEQEAEEEAEPESTEPAEGGDGEAPVQAKPLDPNDPKQYRRLIKKFIDQLQKSAEDEEAKENKKTVYKVRPFNLFGLSLADAVKGVIQAVHPCVPQGLPPQDGEELAVDPDQDEESQVDPRLVPGKKAIHQFGRSLKYCPVTLRDHNLLQLGDSTFWASYQGQRYLFVSQAALEAFIQNPLRYIPQVPPTLPPPRLWFLGVPSAGKRTLASALGAKFKIPIFPHAMEQLELLLATAASQDGGRVADVEIPSQPQNPFLMKAIAVRQELLDFAENQRRQMELKLTTQQQQADRERLRDEGEEVEDLDEEEEAEIAKILEFEQEEPEAKLEREGKAHRSLIALLTRIEPFESRGYLLVGYPSTELEAQQLLEANCLPESVIQLKLSQENFVARRISPVLEAKQKEFKDRCAELKAMRAAQMLAQREAELKRWRRRNIGADDEPAPEAEEIPEDPEPVSMEGIKGELEGSYDTDSSSVASVLALFPERRIPVFELNGDAGQDTVLSTCEEALFSVLIASESRFEAPQVVTFDEAMSLVNNSEKFLSSFGLIDPVKLYLERHGVPPAYVRKPNGKRVIPEPLEPEPEPPKPKEKVKRIVVKQNEDGEDVEVEEEVEPEEEEAPEPEAEEAEPEPEPELSPEELEEMRQEFLSTKKKIADNLKPRACILRNRVYFFQSSENLLTFLRHPLKYWNQAPPLPQQPLVVAVMEPQLSHPEGQRARGLADDIAVNVGLRFLSTPKLVKWALDQKFTLPSLYQIAKSALFDQSTLPNDFVGDAIAARLRLADIQSNGAVLANLPRNYKQFMSITAKGVLFDKVFVVGDDSEATEDPRLLPMMESLLKSVTRQSGSPRDMASLVEACSLTRENLARRKELALRRALGFPARIDNSSVPEAQIEHTLSIFQWYCPYMWARENQLVSCANSRAHVAEYCGETYLFSSEAFLKEFLMFPERFSGERPPPLRPLPTMLPTHIDNGSSIPLEKFEFCGCCPVTLYETRNNRGLKGVTEPKAVLGSPDHCVEYDGKTYAMVDDRALTLFLRQPWVYTTGATLPLAHKLPYTNPQWHELSAETYITRTLYEKVAGALLAVAQTRPKFPGLSLEESALKYVALHLKANNDTNTEFRRDCYTKSLSEYEERATLYKTVTTVAPEDPEERVLFEHRCRVWDAVQDDPSCYEKYSTLPSPQ
jgi:adenylate kinase family enzyme/YHS domain-containing protein